MGSSADTPQFAVTALARWWQEEGRQRFLTATQLLVLADAGDSNGCRSRSFKLHLQEQLSDRYGLSVTVCHYPTGCSKWNPIEHRLFSQISLDWAGKPLRSLDIMLNYICGTTQTGLTVRVAGLDGTFEKGQKVSMTRYSNSTSNSRTCIASGTIPSAHVSQPFPRRLTSRKRRKLFFNKPL